MLKKEKSGNSKANACLEKFEAMNIKKKINE